MRKKETLIIDCQCEEFRSNEFQTHILGTKLMCVSCIPIYSNGLGIPGKNETIANMTHKNFPQNQPARDQYAGTRALTEVQRKPMKK